jgi:hypothetical protein
MRGTVDIIFLLATLFAVVIAVAAGLYITNSLFSGFTNNTVISGCTNCVNALNRGSQAEAIFPNAIVLIFILLCFASVILAAFLESSPVFLIFEVISIPIELLLSFVFHDAFFNIADQSFIGATLASSPSISLLFQYLPVVVLGMAVVIALVTFSK